MANGNNGSSSGGGIGSTSTVQWATGTLSSQNTLKILVVQVYPSDKKPGTGNVDDTWRNVATYYDQVSYHMLKVDYDLAGWYKLSGVTSDYITNDNVKPDQDTLVRLFSEAACAATHSGGFDLNNYQIMACIISLDGVSGIRGYSDLVMSQFVCDVNNQSINISLKNPIYILVLDDQATSGRCAHEVGHCLISAPTIPPGSTVDDEPQQSEDLYADPPYCPDSSAACFDLMGDHDDMPLFSGYFMEKLGYYSGNDIKLIPWNSDKYKGTFHVAARGSDGGASPNQTAYRLLKIYVSDSLSYYVEVRQRSLGKNCHLPSGVTKQVFDCNIPVSPIGISSNDEDYGGVVVTQVLTDTDMNTNQEMRFINLLDYECNYQGTTTMPKYPSSAVLKENAQALDLARGLTINVKAPVQAWPLVYEVEVRWDKSLAEEGSVIPAKGDPSAKNNLRIRQGDKPGQPGWESPDIWVEREPFVKKHVWDYGWDTNNNKPKYSGDRPINGRRHRVYARVYCDGTQDAKDVEVGFYVVSPPYVGFDGNWSSYLGHAKASISAGGYKDLCAPEHWIPEFSDLTCIMVCVEEPGTERNYSDNEAKEIVFDMEYNESESSGNFTPIVKVVNVMNPFTTSKTIFFTVEKAPGFNVVLSKYSMPLGPKGTSTVEMTITLAQNHSNHVKIGVPSRIRVLGYVLKDDSVASTRIIQPRRISRLIPESAVEVQGITYWITLK